jgi:tetratricopeptide (TPR) repeat protein
LWYLASLLPVLQILPLPVPAFAADRYAYIPSVAFAIAPAIILWQVRRVLLERQATAVASVLVAAAVVYAGVLGVATSSRNRVWRSSETLWRDVLAKDGANRFALVNLGQFYLEQGNMKQARGFFSRAVKVDPGFLLSYFNLGLTYEKSGNLSEAARYYAKDLKTPSSLTAKATAETRAQAAFALARIRFGERKYLSARHYADVAVALDGDLEGPAAYYVAADKAIRASRDLADGLVETGDALAATDPEKAASLYAKAAEEAREYGVPVTRLARLYLKLGRYQEALDKFAAASELVEPPADLEYDYGLAALHLSRYDVAAEHLMKALVLDPSMEKAKVKLALARAYLGEPAQALLMLQEVLAKDPANAEARANYEAIRAFLERAIKKSANAAK